MIQYSIFINNGSFWQCIYKPGTDAAVTGAKLDLALNDAGALEFTVPPSNALHDMLIERSTKVQVQKNGEEYWYGYILEVTENFRKEKKVYCVGELAYLNDTIQPQAKYQHKTPLQLFTAYLNQHNAQSSEQFLVGMVTVEDPNDDVYRYTNLESTLTALRDDLCASLQGYLRIRRVGGSRYLDLVKIDDYGAQNKQPIQFGYNLLDYACNKTAADIATACRPKGARLETQVIDGLDAYVDITSVNDGVDYVEDDVAVQNFGMIKKVVSWDNVNDPQILKDKAEAWLADNQFATMTLNVSAVDMSALIVGAASESFEVGDRVHALAEPYGMNTRFPIYSASIDLQDYTKTVYTLSNVTQMTYTQLQAAVVNAVEHELNDASSFLNQFIRNQTGIINNTEGHYTIQRNAHYMTGWTISDTEDPAQATMLIRATLGGIGISDDGGVTYKLALTGQGINADTIVTGHLSADRISGGLIETSNFKSTGTKYFYRSNYSASDMTRIQNITMHTVTPTAADFNKYDLNADGTINTQDYAICRNIIDGNYGTYLAIDYRFEIIQGTTEVSCYIRRYAQNGSYDTGWKQLVSLSAGGIRVTEAGNGENTYIGGHSITSNNLTIYGNGYFSGTVTQGSREELKKDIEPAYDMLQKVVESDIYSFRYKFETETDKKHFGLIIGDKYRTADEVISQNQDGIDNYSMTSILWKAVQELSAKVNELESKSEGVSDK